MKSPLPGTHWRTYCLSVACLGLFSPASPSAEAPKLWDTFPEGKGSINSLAFSPDGKNLAAGGRGGGVKLWAIATGKLRMTLGGPGLDSRCVVFSTDGKILYSANADETVRLWEVGSGKPVAVLKHSHVVNSLALSPDGKILAAGVQDGTIKLWSISSLKERVTLRTLGPWIRSLSFNSDGQLLASVGADKQIRLWEVATGKEKAALRRGNNFISCIAFSPNGQILAIVDSHEITLWDVAKKEAKKSLQDGRFHSVAFSPDGRILASGGEDEIVRLWDVATGKVMATLEDHTSSIHSVTFSPDGRTLASGGEDGCIRLWDLADRPSRLKRLKERAILRGHTKLVHAVAFHPGGKALASSSLDETVRHWDLTAGREKVIRKGEEYWSLSFRPDGKVLALGGKGLLGGLAKQEVKWIDPDAGKELAALKEKGEVVYEVRFSPDGKLLAAGGKGSTAAKIWDASTRKVRTTLTVEKHPWANYSTCLAFSPDGKTLAVGQEHFPAVGSVIFFDVATGKVKVRSDYGANCLAFSPDGKTLAVDTSYGVRLLDTATGKQIGYLGGHHQYITCLVFHPHEKVLATGSRDRTVKLWDTATGKEKATFWGHVGAVWSVAFSPDGRTLASGCGDGTIKLWDVPAVRPAGK